MKILGTALVVLLIFASCSSSEKSVKQILQNVSTVEEVDALREKHPEWEIEIMEASTDGRPLNDRLSRLIEDEIVTVEETPGVYNYRLLTMDSVKEYSFRYIFFSGKELSQPQIDARREEVVKRYHQGQDFGTLANQFTMDGNTSGGAMGWMEEHELLPEFAAAIRKHRSGDIFPLDIPEQNFHYLILKGSEERVKLRMQILKVKAPQEQPAP